MKVLFKEDGRAAYTVEGVCAVPDGMVIADVPAEFSNLPLNYLRFSSQSGVVIDVSDDPSVAVVDGVVVPTLDSLKTKQAAKVSSSCAAAITGGFQSSALGKAYTYPSQQTDQANLAANMLSSMYSGLPANWTTLQLCADSKGVWDYRPHTAAQIQQVGIDGKAAIMACLTKNATLQAQIKAAPDVATVQQIVW